MKTHLVVLISGNGSNLQSIIDAIENGSINATLAGVISNNPDAFGLVRAQKHGIPICVLPHRDYANREQYDAALLAKTQAFHPDLIILAGFMRILTPVFVSPLQGKIINIHPSLLPKYPGLHTHAQVLHNQDQEHGVTIHFVTPELDAGPIICQTRLKVDAKDTEETLKQRIHQLEHMAYPQVVQWFAKKSLRLENNHVFLNGLPLEKQGINLPCTNLS